MCFCTYKMVLIDHFLQKHTCHCVGFARNSQFNNINRKTMKNQRTIRKELRLTPEENELFLQKAASYPTVSYMIREAVKYFDNKLIRHKTECFEELTTTIDSFRTKLGYQGNNLNLIAHACNALVISGKLDQRFVSNEVMPAIDAALGRLTAISLTLTSIYKKLYK